MKKGRENFILVLILVLIGAFFFAFFRIADTYNLGHEFPVTGFAVDDVIDENQTPAQDIPSGINTQTKSSDVGSSDTGTDEAALSAGSDSAGTDALAEDGEAEQGTTEPIIKKIEEKPTPQLQMPSLVNTDSIAYIAAIGFFVVVIAVLAAVFLIKPKKNKQNQMPAQQMPQTNAMNMQNAQNMQVQQQIDPQIASYVYQMKQSGYSAMQIRQQLTSSGWQQPQIDDMFRKMGIF